MKLMRLVSANKQAVHNPRFPKIINKIKRKKGKGKGKKKTKKRSSRRRAIKWMS